MEFSCDVDYDPFALMQEKDMKYGKLLRYTSANQFLRRVLISLLIFHAKVGPYP